MVVAFEPIGYQLDGSNYEGLIFHSESAAVPGILVCHAWSGADR